MHIEKIRESIEDMREFKHVPLETLDSMKSIVKYAGNVLTDNNPILTTSEDKKKRLKHVKNEIIKTYASVNNIYDNLDNIEKFIETETPNFVGTEKIQEWKHYKKNSTYALVGSFVTVGLGYLIENTNYGNTFIDEAIFMTAALEAGIYVYTGIRSRKESKSIDVIRYNQEISKYSDLESEVSVSLSSLNRNLSSYLESMNYLKGIYFGDNSALDSNIKREIEMYDKGMDKFHKAFKIVRNSIEQDKLGNNRFYEFSTNLGLVLKKLYNPKLISKYKNKEKYNLEQARKNM